jgi:signal transduction histidine kinase
VVLVVGAELFEQFKRGDISKQTDGSGLGLAIAKSIIDLHGGELNIEIDGDLFKVTITL